MLQWSVVAVTAVTMTVGYSDSFGNPRFVTNKTPLLTVTKNCYSDTFIRHHKSKLTPEIDLVQGGWGEWPIGNGKKLSSCHAQLGQATCLAVA